MSSFFAIRRPLPIPTLFPYTTLFRSLRPVLVLLPRHWQVQPSLQHEEHCAILLHTLSQTMSHNVQINDQPEHYADRKSTRLNSSHSSISYAVFCLKKKNTDFYISL